jgi:Xaa-Pro aminopeptidase
MNPLIYADRRARLAAQLGKHGVAIIPTATEKPRNRDNDYLFRFDSYFHYLTGFTEPNGWLVLRGGGHSTLFCNPKDMEREIWDGIRLGPDAAPEALGVQAAYPVTELGTKLPELLENQATVWYPFAVHPGLETRVDEWLQAVRRKVRQGASCPDTQRDVCVLLDDMRMIKDTHEQDLMRRAAHISAGAHIRAMQVCTQRLRAGQEVREYHLDAELLHEFRLHGSQYPAYGSIVAAGANACVLHYRADNAPIEAGELVLIDAGCELDGYASDITRTFPANGRFSGPQRALYEVVLNAQEAAVAATRAGARFVDGHEAAVRVLSQGLLDLGLLSSDKAGTLEDVIERRLYSRFYMHRTGHWLGMDVHDCGSYVEPTEQHQLVERTDPVTGATQKVRPSRILQPGMMLTIEPGLYVRPAPDVPEAYWNLGIRIEDDALVTAKGCELITRGVPVAPDEIERLMA